MFGIHQMLSQSQLLPIPTIPHSSLIIPHFPFHIPDAPHMRMPVPEHFAHVNEPPGRLSRLTTIKVK
jgi:hypothetical protein